MIKKRLNLALLDGQFTVGLGPRRRPNRDERFRLGTTHLEEESALEGTAVADLRGSVP